MSFDTILIPTDGSDPAEAAADRGFELAASLDAAVHVLAVADSGLATSASYLGDSPRIRERLREAAEANAVALEERARERGLDVTTAVREGIPAEAIVEYAADAGVDAIVIGTHGRGGFERMIVGSVTDKVVRTATVPVLTVTPRTTAASSGTGRNDPASSDAQTDE